jgi:hypothetical protein
MVGLTAGAAEVNELIWQLDDPSSSAISQTAKEAVRHVAEASQIVDCIEMIFAEAVSAGNDAQLTCMWVLVDRLCKEHEGFTEVLRPCIVKFAESYPVPRSSDHFNRFASILEGMKHIFGAAVMSVISIKLRDLLGTRGSDGEARTDAPTSIPGAAMVREQEALAQASAAKQGQLSTLVKSVGGFQLQRSNMARPSGAQHALQVKTRDSLQAVRTAGMYTPAMPAEITMAAPERDANAQKGYMQALPSNHFEQYIDTRKKRLRDMAEKWRQEEDQRRRGQPGADKTAQLRKEGVSEAALAIDTFEDVKMPAELPRDEFGVKIGNFPAGVRFIRDAIRESGGALELSVIEERISQMADKEVQAEFGEVRHFIHIHKPTFRVVEETDRWVVRLTDDPDPDTTKPLSWQKAECPLCSYMLAGRNLPKHTNSRRCVDVQTAMGFNGQPMGPIGNLAFAARCVLDNASNGTLDDDDILFFANCVKEAGEVKRYKFASTARFAPILKALRVVRDAWVKSKGVAEIADAVVNEDDAPVAALFDAFGANLRRLPIAWIDTGDVIDMAKRFTRELLPPHPAVPRAGDPRIRIGNAYPGLMFAQSDSDPDDMPSTDEEEYSDDEGALFEFAPPVSVMETMMAAGIERETKRLNFRLRTAPPIPAANAVKSDGTSTVAQFYSKR